MKTLYIGLIAFILTLGVGCKKEVQEAPAQTVKKAKEASIDLPIDEEWWKGYHGNHNATCPRDCGQNHPPK